LRTSPWWATRGQLALSRSQGNTSDSKANNSKSGSVSDPDSDDINIKKTDEQTQTDEQTESKQPDPDARPEPLPARSPTQRDTQRMSEQIIRSLQVEARSKQRTRDRDLTDLALVDVAEGTAEMRLAAGAIVRDPSLLGLLEDDPGSDREDDKKVLSEGELFEEILAQAKRSLVGELHKSKGTEGLYIVTAGDGTVGMETPGISGDLSSSASSSSSSIGEDGTPEASESVAPSDFAHPYMPFRVDLFLPVLQKLHSVFSTWFSTLFSMPFLTAWLNFETQAYRDLYDGIHVKVRKSNRGEGTSLFATGKQWTASKDVASNNGCRSGKNGNCHAHDSRPAVAATGNGGNPNAVAFRENLSERDEIIATLQKRIRELATGAVAIGSLVARSELEYRKVVGGRNFPCKLMPVAEFPVLRAEEVDTLAPEWPC
jgi:hypothetical protein